MLKKINLNKLIPILVFLLLSKSVFTQIDKQLEEFLKKYDQRCDSIYLSLFKDVKDKKQREYLRNKLNNTNLTYKYFSYIDDNTSGKYYGKLKLKYRILEFYLNSKDTVFVYVNGKPYKYFIPDKDFIGKSFCPNSELTFECKIRYRKNLLITILFKGKKLSFYLPKESKYVFISDYGLCNDEYIWYVVYEKYYYTPTGYYLIE
jgi:hypothetical protein